LVALHFGTLNWAVSSGGEVKLASNNPFDHPLIDPNLLSSNFDKYAMREGVKSVRRFLSAKAWADYVVSPVNIAANPTDTEIDAYVRTFASTVFHPVGTSAMSPAKAGWGVVDPQLRVKGSDGVRVVDASVWPFLPNAHTQAPTYLVAERAASLIRGY
jgi:choline dehydrogenase